MLSVAGTGSVFGLSEIEGTAPAPTGVDLVAAYDTGILDSDDITNLDNSAAEKLLHFAVSGTTVGAIVTLYADGVAIGSAAATDTITTIATDGAHDLADGVCAITARQSLPGDTESSDSPALNVTIDTVAPVQSLNQLTKLMADDGASADNFGCSVSISGNTAIVGAYSADDLGNSSGAAYVFEDTGLGWTQVAELIATDGAAGDCFGRSVAVSGNTAIVGAPADSSIRHTAGSVYVFEDTGSGWTQVAKLTATDGAVDDHFGYSVSISGDIVIVGTYRAGLSGSAYIFEDAGLGWTQVAKLTDDEGTRFEYFGHSVSISGTTAIVGAYFDDLDSGSAHIFNDTGSGWTRVAKLTAADGAVDDHFGYSVSISGNTAIVGAFRNDEHGFNSGSAYVFEDTASGWTQVSKLTADDGTGGEYFGHSVSISGTTIMVGAYNDDGYHTKSGSAYLFESTGSTWSQLAKVVVNEGELFDYFGSSVSINDGTVIIGMPGGDGERLNSGSAYVFTRAPFLDLQTASDSGVSHTDDITHDNTPTFDVAAVPYFRVYRNGSQISGDYETGKSYTDSVPADGTYVYTVVAMDAAGNESPADSGLSITIDTDAPPAPTAPKLQPASDTGISDTDNVTSDTTPTFDVEAFPYFRLRRDGFLTGGSGTGTSWTDSVPADGVYAYTLTAVDVAGNESPPSAPLTVTVDTLAPPLLPRQLAKLVAGDGTPGDEFGRCVSLSGDTAFVAAYRNESDRGAAYVFDESVSGWPQLAKLIASDGEAGDEFAWSLSVSGNTAIIGTDWDDDRGFHAGAAYIFEDTGSGWTQVAKLTAADAGADDRFGDAVAIIGNTVIVGAPKHNSEWGAVYVFQNTGSGWTQVAELVASGFSYLFGRSVAISDNTILVGGSGNSSRGSAYVFENSGSGWVQTATLIASDGAAGDAFSDSLAISGGVAVIGAAKDDDHGTSSGSAYMFEKISGTWTQVAKLVPEDGAADDGFGCSVSISDGTAIIGARNDDDNGLNSGSVYVFVDGDSGWTQVAKTTAGGGARVSGFGSSVSISGLLTVVSAYNSAYVFSLAPTLDLQAVSDTGTSDADNITSDNTPTFDVGAAPYFRVYRDGVRISGDYESGTNYTDVAGIDGAHDYTVRSVDAAGNESVESSVLTVNIDTAMPTVALVASATTTDTTPNVTVTAFDDSELPDGTAVALDVDLNNDGDFDDAGERGYVCAALTGGAATFDIEPAVSVGVYPLRARVADMAGNEDAGAAITTIVFLGDANVDLVVDDRDASILAAHWRQAGGWADGDFNGDGSVDDRDASILATHWHAAAPGTTPGDANVDGMVNELDSAILTDHWRQRGGWIDGDFNGDEFVDDLDAAILTAHWGETAESQTPVADIVQSTDEPALALDARFIGPRQAPMTAVARRRIEPCRAVERAATSVAARDAALSEVLDDAESLDYRLAWSYAMASRQSPRRNDAPRDDSVLAIDLLLMDSQ